MLQCFDQLEPDRLVSALERGVEVQLEAGLEELHLFGKASAFLRKAVEDEELGDQVKEDERTGACTEGHMRARWRELEAAAHRALDVIDFLFIKLVMSPFLGLQSAHRTDILLAQHGSVDVRGEALWLVIRFHSQVNRALILVQHHRVCKVVIAVV